MFAGRFHSFVLCFVWCVALTASGSYVLGDSKILRKNVLTAEGLVESSRAYQALFSHVAPMELTRLQQDEHLGIALQAAWEHYTVPVSRQRQSRHKRHGSHARSQGNIVYDTHQLKAFVRFVQQRSGARVPEWWKATIIDIEVVPRRGHLYGNAYKQSDPGFVEAAAGRYVRSGVTLKDSNGVLRYTHKDRIVEFRKDLFDSSFESLLAHVTESQSVVAAFSGALGCEFKVAAFRGGDLQPEWTSKIWAAGRTSLGGVCFHRVELVVSKGTLFVFGAEFQGLYLEAFKLSTGECLYRFSTSYWGHYSEAWQNE